MIHLENFRAGQWELSTTGYKHFVPNRINDFWVWEDTQVNRLLEKAAIKLGELNSFSKIGTQY